MQNGAHSGRVSRQPQEYQNKQKYVVVSEHDGGGVFCYGIYNDYDTALHCVGAE